MAKINWQKRSDNLEVMDDLNCSGAVVFQTLKELDFINKVLGGNQLSVQALGLLLKKSTEKKPVQLVDLGTGSGYMLNLFSKWAQKSGARLHLLGIDVNPHIVQMAQEMNPEYSFESLNIFSEEFLFREYDIVHASLFFHHFSQEELIDFFSKLKTRARKGIIINDLHRHPLAYHSIRLLTKAFSQSAMVKYDAPLSVLRGFKRQEWKEILEAADIRHYTIKWRWAFRWQIIIHCS